MAIDSSIKNLRSQFNGWSEELKNTSPSGHGERQILTRPVEKILMVGGLESTPGSLNFWDNERLQVAAKTLMANNIPLSKDIAFQNINLSQAGEDFLDCKYTGDVVIISKLFGASPDACNPPGPDYAVSPRHHEEGIWAKAVHSAGARFVFFFPSDGGFECLSPQILSGSEYKQPTEYLLEDEQNVHDFNILSREGLLPMAVACPSLNPQPWHRSSLLIRG